MTYTEKMILSGLAVWGYTRNYAKGFSRRGEDVSVVIAFLGGLGITTSFAFSMVWIWSQ